MKMQLIYKLNGRDEFIFFNEAWESFALANDAPDLTPERIMGRRLWDFISGETTTQLYRDLLRSVRAGNRASFTFRCDAPERRRFMEMSITALGGGEVQFVTTTRREEERSSQPLIDRNVSRAASLLRVCSWCKRVDVGREDWAELDEAVRLMRLFESRELPSLTHGICSPCHQNLAAKLAEMKGRV